MKMLNLICTRQLLLSVALRKVAPCPAAASPNNFTRRTKASVTTSGPSPSDSQTSAGPKKLLSAIIEEEPLDPPIKYSTSKASKWLAHDTHTNINTNAHPWNGLVFSFSTALLMLWFCILREENDIDEEMKKTLWERVPGLERQQLEVVLDYNRQTGLPTEDVRRRIAELDGKPYTPEQ